LGNDSSTAGFELRDRLRKARLVQVVDGKGGARLGQPEGGGTAQAGACARDRGNLAGERLAQLAITVATAARRSSSEGSTSRSSEAEYGIGVSLAVTRSGVALSSEIPT
jgi:hypothetical protein